MSPYNTMGRTPVCMDEWMNPIGGISEFTKTEWQMRSSSGPTLDATDATEVASPRSYTRSDDYVYMIW